MRTTENDNQNTAGEFAMRPISKLPKDYKRIKRVDSFEAFLKESFGGPDGVNGILYHRPIPADLAEDFRATAKALRESRLKRLEDGTYAGAHSGQPKRILPIFTTAAVKRGLQALQDDHEAFIRAGYGDSVVRFDHCDREPFDKFNTYPLCNVFITYAGTGQRIVMNEDAEPIDMVKDVAGYSCKLKKGASIFYLEPGDMLRLDIQPDGNKTDRVVKCDPRNNQGPYLQLDIAR
jgi:hypothetical protein